MEQSISDVIRSIREHINEPRKQFTLMQRKRDWTKLCSCLDTIDDVEMALESYLLLDDFTAFNGGYLYIYGVMQALYIQQDALFDLRDGIFDKKDSMAIVLAQRPELRNIREIRNNSAGHPTNRYGKSSHMIVQQSISKSGFELLSDYVVGTTSFSKIDVIDLIQVQQEEVKTCIAEIAKELEEEAQMHKEKYKEEKLADLLNLSRYTIEKISSCTYIDNSISGKENMAFSLAHSLYETLQVLFKKILERYGHQIDSVEYIQPKIEYVFSKLFELHSAGTINGNMEAIILVDALNEYLKDLTQIAKEIDDEYSTENLA